MSSVLIHRLSIVIVLLGLVAAYLAVDPAGAEQSGGQGVIVKFRGSISPRRMPRHRPVPISLTLAGEVRPDAGASPPQLSRIEVAFGAPGGLETAGLPTCSRASLRNTTQRQALARCGYASVGRGELTTEVPLDPADPLLADANIVAFNGRADGHPAVWVHAYSSSPPVSFVLPFYLRRLGGGVFGIQMRAPIRRALGHWPRLRSFRITLGRRYRFAGEQRSYLSAHCPLPPRFTVGTFPIARVTSHFQPRPNLTTTITRGCRVRR